MLRYSLRRIPSALIVLAIGSVVIFTLLRLVPGDPAQILAGPDSSPEALESIRDDLGLTGSQVGQYFSWLGGVGSFDLGHSLILGGDIGSLLLDALGNTVVLAAAALLLAVVIAFTMSTVSVIVDRRWLNSVVTGFGTVAVAIPNFVTGTILVVLFGVVWAVLPAGGVPRSGFLDDPGISVQYLILPAVCLALPIAAALTRFLTESLRSQLAEPYVTTARALGISRRRIVLTQALPNALPSTVTVLGMQVGHLLGGTVLVEAIFAWPGLGHLIERAISSRDYPVVQVMLLFSVGLFVAVQLITDLVNAWLDPRIRLGGHA
ncbi:ABC transporter permease subunit [Rhodococcus hoagii]|uniref:ABC transporter permease n=1 Tax=Rhodococcus hoagii TaxID=43767 RepID=UPI0019F19F00|nr:ABC transporter permease [Prescottella equi]NKS50645.1 ABC transporter permease subunit [Prescottella equi]WJJ09537.1 ABC transporter permease [Prescottella equi]